jgi:predicted transposase YdaD
LAQRGAVNAFDLIGRQAMRESKFYQEILEEGREEGREEGLRHAVREVLVQRFGESAASEFADSLGLVHDLEPLSKLLTAAVKARSLVGFKKALTAELKR